MLSVLTPPRSTPPPDHAVFNQARSEGRAIVTENIRDYRPLAQVVHAAGETHSSLILTIAKRWPRHDPGALITALHELARANSDEIDNEEHFL